MCKNAGKEGTASLVVIPAWFRRYRKKTRGGLEIVPPSGARVNSRFELAHIRSYRRNRILVIFGHWPDLRGQRLSKDLKLGCQRLRLVASNTLVF